MEVNTHNGNQPIRKSFNSSNVKLAFMWSSRKLDQHKFFFTIIFVVQQSWEPFYSFAHYISQFVFSMTVEKIWNENNLILTVRYYIIMNKKSIEYNIYELSCNLFSFKRNIMMIKSVPIRCNLTNIFVSIRIIFVPK